MNFILVGGKICVATHLTFDKGLQTQGISRATSMRSATATVGNHATGEMLLFRRGKLPEIFRDDGVVRKMEVAFAQNDAVYTLDDVIFTARRPMPNTYDKCEAAYLEYAATDVTVNTMPKTINRKVTI